MTGSMLKTQSLPYCKGCGHDLIAVHTTKALERLGYDPLDVIMVTDIGCHGIIDKCLNTHTVHGLHGRSAALGAGVFFGLEDTDKKVVVFIGDCGATIGLQHILEAARLNLDICVVVHNNMLYGMTGGQTSGLTPQGFRTTTSGEGNPLTAYDICQLTHTAGASYVARIAGIGDISADLEKAFSQKGFSLIEIMEICPSYGVKLNPGRKLKDVVKESGREFGEWLGNRQVFTHQQGKKNSDLLQQLQLIKKQFSHKLDDLQTIVISGSAGEGVQLSANLLAKAAMSTGLEVTQKGSYPVTVGVGFSTAEINLSPDSVNFHGISIPRIAIITSTDGLNHNRNRIQQMGSGTLYIDSSLTPPETSAKIISRDFRSMGARNASIYAMMYYIQESGVFDMEAIYHIMEMEGKSGKLPVEKIREALND